MLTFKMFAGTDIGLRENNEDNFTVCPNLAQGRWAVPARPEQVVSLGKMGSMVVVADGMGGQNAGEVASAIAIRTVEEFFSPSRLTKKVTASNETISEYLKSAISEADYRIKAHAKRNPDTLGMGSTLVIAWIFRDTLYVAWIGDSRAYSYVPEMGIGRLTKDHSYVQQLVDSGEMTDEEAMASPNSNIITRSLGDSSQRAKGDVTIHALVGGEVILLCSDGLCGVCTDEEIGTIVEEQCNDLQTCKDALTTAALKAGGSDNITIALMRIESCAAGKSPVPAKSSAVAGPTGRRFLSSLLAVLFALLLLVAIGYAGYSLFSTEPDEPDTISLTVEGDSLVEGRTLIFRVRLGGDVTAYEIQCDGNLICADRLRGILTLAPGARFSDADSTLVRVVATGGGTVSDSVYVKLFHAPKKVTLRPLEENKPEDSIEVQPGNGNVQMTPLPTSEDGGGKSTGNKTGTQGTIKLVPSKGTNSAQPTQNKNN